MNARMQHCTWCLLQCSGVARVLWVVARYVVAWVFCKDIVGV